MGEGYWSPSSPGTWRRASERSPLVGARLWEPSPAVVRSDAHSRRAYDLISSITYRKIGQIVENQNVIFLKLVHIKLKTDMKNNAKFYALER